ncbi:helix-turn-helix domain-containing protein [Mesoflavibacter sp. CH_XMU1422-2]|uniref:helix-turn-helix domain-containing protein n=1 Tax=Mesoflavibacter sp. CH_XMU1422-2 TaxID=3107770 RepID=UPI00300A104F
MEGIVLQNVSPSDFKNLYNEVKELSRNVKSLAEKKQQEKITPEEAAEEIGVTTQTIYAYIKSGKIPASKLGRKLVIKRIDLEQALIDVKSLNYKR